MISGVDPAGRGRGPDTPGSSPRVPRTVHPSAILRLDPGERDAAFDALVADLKVVAAQRSEEPS